jgi:hypothetical protein
MTEEEKYIKEHNLDDIDSFLFKEFSIIGGCCSAQKGFEYRVARQVAEKLWKKEEPVSVDWEQRRYEIAREMLPYAAETSRTILMTGHSLGDDAKGKTLAEVCASSAVSFADALIAELRKQPNQETKPEKQPNKKEVAIGEVVEYQGGHLLCVETDNEDCFGCAFAEDDVCEFCAYCSKELRSDGKNVIFVEKKK